MANIRPKTFKNFCDQSGRQNMPVITWLCVELYIDERQSRRSSLPRTFTEINAVFVYLLERSGVRTTIRRPMAVVEIHSARSEPVARNSAQCRHYISRKRSPVLIGFHRSFFVTRKNVTSVVVRLPLSVSSSTTTTAPCRSYHVCRARTLFVNRRIAYTTILLLGFD